MRVAPAALPFAALAAPAPALAHAGERAFVLLLPTGYYIAGGTLAVAATFLLLLFVPAAAFRRLAAARRPLCELPALPPTATSALSFALLVLLLAAGFYGSRDPLANPLPLTVWTLWWVGLTMAHALFGNLWAWLNPWLAPYRWLQRLGLGRAWDYPRRLGYWPATIAFLAFAWFELVDPAPDDPARLSAAAIVYSAVTLGGMLLFGERAWLARGECFSVFFAFVARLSPLRVEPADRETFDRHTLSLAFPGAALARHEPLPLGGTLFVLLTLATVSFDGLAETFWWLALGGINPLEFPGRTAVMARNSAGLVAMWAALAAAYGLAILLGCRLAGRSIAARVQLGAFVLSILPISLGYHLAHYLTAFLVNAQYAVYALADPFARSPGHAYVTVSFLADYDAVHVIWAVQAAAVVIGHVLAVVLAHLVAVVRFADARAAALSQLPLALLMVAYTLFGLWLLAAPTAG
jgi:hypothetical protein